MGTPDLETVRRRMQAWFAGQRPDWREVTVGEIHVPAGGGNSAETSFLEVSYLQEGASRSQTLVLRRQIEGHDIFLDSDLNLPFQMMRAVAERSSVPVPPAFGIEFDRAILGSPFLVMEAVEGRIVPQSPNYNATGWLAELPPAQQKQVWLSAIEAMAAINRLDWRAGFGFLARPERGRPGLDQYLKGVELWHAWAADGRRLPLFETALAYLREHEPADLPACVLWGDSHAANIMFREDLSVSAVIDWEAAALGVAEVDFGYWLFFDELYSSGSGVPRLAGLPGRDEMTACFARALGREPRDVRYFEILAALRFAICLLRFADRMVALEKIPASSTAGVQNPASLILAQKLGLKAGEDMSDFIAMSVAAGRG